MRDSDADHAVPELLDALKRALSPGEAIVWQGVPDPQLFRKDKTRGILFGLAFVGMSLVWVGAVLLAMKASPANRQPPIWFPYISTPMLLIGLFLLLGQGWMLRKNCERTIYALTQNRAILIEGGWWSRSQSVHSYYPDQLKSMYRIENPDGAGDLVLETIIREHRGNVQKWPRGFRGIRDVRGLEGLMRSTLRIE